MNRARHRGLWFHVAYYTLYKQTNWLWGKQLPLLFLAEKNVHAKICEKRGQENFLLFACKWLFSGSFSPKSSIVIFLSSFFFSFFFLRVDFLSRYWRIMARNLGFSARRTTAAFSYLWNNHGDQVYKEMYGAKIIVENFSLSCNSCRQGFHQ